MRACHENLFVWLQSLTGAPPLRSAQIAAAFADGTALVTYDGTNASARAHNPLQLAAGQPVFVQAGRITGPAPDLPYTEIEIT